MKDGAVPQSEIGPLTSCNPPFCVCSLLCPFYSFLSLFFPLLLRHSVLTFLLLFMLSSIPLTVLLSFHFSPFCIHPYPPFISMASYFFSFIWPFISLRSTLSPSPSARVCVCLCVWQLCACGYFSGSSPEDWTVIIYGPEL